MPWRSAPVGGLLFDNIVDEASQLGPERPALPEEAVDRDCKSKTDEHSQKAGRNDRGNWDANVWSKIKIQSLRCKEDGNLGAEDDTSNSEESKSVLVASPA